MPISSPTPIAMGTLIVASIATRAARPIWTRARLPPPRVSVRLIPARRSPAPRPTIPAPASVTANAGAVARQAVAAASSR